MGNSRASDPPRSSQPEEPLMLSCIFPLLLLCSRHATQPHSSVRGYYSLRMPRRAGCQRPATPPFPGVSSCVLVNAVLAPADLSAQPSGLFSPAAPAAFHTGQVSGAFISSLPPPSLYPAPTASCILVLDHPLLWIIPPLPFKLPFTNLSALDLIMSGPVLMWVVLGYPDI